MLRRNSENEMQLLEPDVDFPFTELCCPIEDVPFKDPVLGTDGHIYNRRPIQEWLKRNPTSPVTREIILISELPDPLLKKLTRIIEESKKIAEEHHRENKALQEENQKLKDQLAKSDHNLNESRKLLKTFTESSPPSIAKQPEHKPLEQPKEYKDDYLQAFLNARLFKEINLGSISGATYYLKEGADPNALDAKGNTPLIAATSHENPNITYRLLVLLFQHKVNVNFQGNKRATALHHATVRNNILIVRYLLEKGANPLIYNDLYETPRTQGKLLLGDKFDPNLDAILYAREVTQGNLMSLRSEPLGMFSKKSPSPYQYPYESKGLTL